MDKLITDEATVAMLAGLGTSAGDYLSRIERLEQAYGGPNRLKNHHLRVLRKLEGQIDESLDTFKTYTYAVDNYLKNSLDSEAENLVLLHLLKGRMSRALRVEYNAYLQQERVTDDNQSMSLFLRNKLTTEIEARGGGSSLPPSSSEAHYATKTECTEAKGAWISTDTSSRKGSCLRDFVGQRGYGENALHSTSDSASSCSEKASRSLQNKVHCMQQRAALCNQLRAILSHEA